MADSKQKSKYEESTKAELLGICKEMGITVSARAKKDQIIKIIESQEKAELPKETAGQGSLGKPKAKNKKPGAKKAKPKKEDPELPRQQPAPREKDSVPDDDRTPATGSTLWDFAHSMDGIKPRNTAKPQQGTRSFSGTPTSFKSESELELAQSRDDVYSPLIGTVGGCDEEIIRYYTSEKTGERLPFIYVGVSYKDKWIRIPSYAFWDDYESFVKKLPDPKRLLSNTNHRMGAEVDFNFMFAQDENDGNGLQYYGIRLLALKRQRADTWYSKHEGRWNMNSGDIAEARVVEVWPGHIIIEVGGVETTLHKRDVTKRTIDDLTDVEKGGFEPGDVARVMITDIKRQSMPEDLFGFTYPVSITASMSALEDDPNKKYFYQFKKNQTRRAFVKNITTDLRDPNGKTAYYCEIEDVPAVVRCYLGGGLAKAGLAPKRGDSVRIRISDKQITAKGEYWIYGEIFRVVKEKKKNDIAFIVNK